MKSSAALPVHNDEVSRLNAYVAIDEERADFRPGLQEYPELHFDPAGFRDSK